MPAKKEHKIVTTLLAVILGILIYPQITNAIIFTLLALMTATMPDRIEKPTHKMHRGFYHSITLFTILIITLIKTINNPLSGIIFGYTTHLLLDYARTKHKPII